MLERSSRGEVVKPETINYRTHTSQKEVVCFVNVVFGPAKDL